MPDQNDILGLLLERLDSRDDEFHIVTAREVHTWPSTMLDSLCRDGLLVPTSPSNLYTCTECNDEHDEEVMVVESPLGSAPRMYIMCSSVWPR